MGRRRANLIRWCIIENRRTRAVGCTRVVVRQESMRHAIERLKEPPNNKAIIFSCPARVLSSLQPSAQARCLIRGYFYHRAGLLYLSYPPLSALVTRIAHLHNPRKNPRLSQVRPRLLLVISSHTTAHSIQDIRACNGCNEKESTGIDRPCGHYCQTQLLDSREYHGQTSCPAFRMPR